MQYLLRTVSENLALKVTFIWKSNEMKVKKISHFAESQLKPKWKSGLTVKLEWKWNFIAVQTMHRSVAPLPVKIYFSTRKRIENVSCISF